MSREAVMQSSENREHRRPQSTYLTTKNPFYLISAGLVLYGISEGASQLGMQHAAMFASFALAVYGVLLSVVGVLLVRWLRVWDDARTVLLVVLLCLAGLAVGFDVVAFHQPLAAAPWLGAGLIFSLATTETVLWLLGLAWPWRWRLPFATMMTLLFASPLLATPAWLGADTVVWRVLLFPVLAGLAMLTLLPAVWAGPVEPVQTANSAHTVV